MKKTTDKSDRVKHQRMQKWWHNRVLQVVLGVAVIMLLGGGAYHIYTKPCSYEACFYSTSNGNEKSTVEALAAEEFQSHAAALSAVETYPTRIPQHQMPLTLPRDFAFHDDMAQERWHYVANVEDRSGHRYGIHWTFMRVEQEKAHLDHPQRRASTGWQNSHLYIVQTVITSQHQVWREQRFARGGIGQAGLIKQPFTLWIDNWSWRASDEQPFPGTLTVDTDQFSFSLFHRSPVTWRFLGDNGYQILHDRVPLTSFGIVAPSFPVSGTLTLDGQAPFTVQGRAWLDKAWSNNLLEADRLGWDWFMIPLANGATLSVNRYRDRYQMPQISAQLFKADGSQIRFDRRQMTVRALWPLDSVDGRSLPLRWQIVIPSEHIDLTTHVLNRHDWHTFASSYWQGPIEVRGSDKGQGFMRLSDY